MNRIILAISLLSVACCTGPRIVEGSDLPAVSRGRIAVDVADLKDQLENGLRARLPREFAFLARVVALVRTGEMSAEMVTSTYNWARRKHPRPYPYPYFEAALRMRAREAGIDL